MEKNKKMTLLILDSNSLIHRAFHALPPLTTRKGQEVGAIYGFLLGLFKALKEFKPDFVAAAFDAPGLTFRHKEFKAYKAKRPKIPPQLSWQIEQTKKILEAFGIPVFEKKGFEADDIIGTISNLAPKKQIFPEVKIIILSGDLDMLQLVKPQTYVCFPQKGVKGTILYDLKLVRKKYSGLEPSQLVDFKALRGDPSDNIPGVRGIGEKTAITLIKEFKTLENLYFEIENHTERSAKIKPKIKELLLRHKEEAFFSKQLSQITCNVPIDFDLEKCRFGKYDEQKIKTLFEKLEFFSLIKKLPEIFNSKVSGNLLK